MKTFILAGVAVLFAVPAFAQAPAVAPHQPGTTGTTIVREPNSTGNDRDVVISRGATGADTATTDSAAGGNASRPEQAVPNSSSR